MSKGIKSLILGIFLALLSSSAVAGSYISVSYGYSSGNYYPRYYSYPRFYSSYYYPRYFPSYHHVPREVIVGKPAVPYQRSLVPKLEAEGEAKKFAMLEAERQAANPQIQPPEQKSYVHPIPDLGFPELQEQRNIEIPKILRD
jgi:hypothetical protein